MSSSISATTSAACTIASPLTQDFSFPVTSDFANDQGVCMLGTGGNNTAILQSSCPTTVQITPSGCRMFCGNLTAVRDIQEVDNSLQNATGLNGTTDCFFVGDKSAGAARSTPWCSVLLVGLAMIGGWGLA